MPRILTFFHTAVVHSETFDALRDRIAPGVAMHHNIRTGWLQRAQQGISPELAAEIRREVAGARRPVICTCTTIGPMAEAAGAIRIDQPMMQAAAQSAGPVLMVYCLQSTLSPSRELLRTAMLAAGNAAPVHVLSLSHLWPLFENGESQAFEMAIARAVAEHVQSGPAPGCVVLAQASMAGATSYTRGLPCPVLASPELAMRAGLALL